MVSNCPQDHRDPEASLPVRASEAASPGMLGEPAGDSWGLGPAQPAVPGGPGAQFSMDLLWRSKWLILGVFVLVAGAALPLVWLTQTPVYRATALVRVSPVISRIVFKTEDNGLVPLYQSFLNTQVSIIQSPKVMQRVLDSEEVQQTKWYREQPQNWRTMLGADPPNRMDRLREAITARPRKDTELIGVSMTAASAREAQLIVDAVVNTYKRCSDELLQEVDLRRFDTLSAERSTLRQEIDSLLESKFSYARELGTLDPSELRSQLATQLSVLEAERDELQRRVAIAQYQLETLQPAPAETDPADPADADAGDDEDAALINYARDAEWRQLHYAYEQAAHQLELGRQKYGEAHPEIQRLTADVEHTKRMRGEREAQLRNQRHSAAVLATAPDEQLPLDRSQAEWNLQVQQRELALLEDSITAQREKVATAGDLARRIARFDEEINNKRELYDVVRSRLQQLEIESRAPARISVAAPATTPTEPDRDRRIMLSLLALGGALSLGVACAYLRSSTDPRIRGFGDVPPPMRVPFLGHLPSLVSVRGKAAWEHDPSVVEGLRMLRTALLRRVAGTDDRVVLITSSSSREGKTSVAIGLARSLAQLGKRALLVEADLRQPSLTQRLGIEEPATGLGAMLCGDARDEDAIIIGRDLPGFHILPAGPHREDFSPELLANGVFSACLRRWKQRYDYVILDSPPVLPVADARILASQADGVVMIMRSAHCRRTDALRACSDLSLAGARLLGTVLVGVTGRERYGDRYGYGYGYGYGYTYGRAYVATGRELPHGPGNGTATATAPAGTAAPPAQDPSASEDA